jgi:hypothetical protein
MTAGIDRGMPVIATKLMSMLGPVRMDMEATHS